MLRIQVPERGAVELTREAWDKLASQDVFWGLCDQGILSIAQRGRGLRALKASCYVGRALVGDVLVEITEKIEGALTSLLPFATGAVLRAEEMPSRASDLGGLFSVIARRFLEEAAAYVARGRRFEYRSERRVGSLAGGRLEIIPTLRLRARGLSHLLAFQKDTVSFRVTLNRVILAALRQIENLAVVVHIPSCDLSRGRELALLFTDSIDTEVLFGRTEAFVEMSERLRRDPSLARERDLVALAAVILAGESFEPTAPRARSLPITWFLNLEKLFETAVRVSLKALVGEGTSITAGAAAMRFVITKPGREQQAEPDLAILRASESYIVGDVKYKSWDGGPAHSDIYQLLVHASAFGARECFLVYPSTSFEIADFGVASTGARVRAFSVDVRALARDLSRLLKTLGVPVADGVARSNGVTELA